MEICNIIHIHFSVSMTNCFLNNTLYYHHSAYTSNKKEIQETENPSCYKMVT